MVLVVFTTGCNSVPWCFVKSLAPSTQQILPRTTTDSSLNGHGQYIKRVCSLSTSQCIFFYLYLTWQVSLRTNSYLQWRPTQAMLGQLCAALWDSQSWPDVIQPGIKPGTVVTPLSLRCSALDCCATRELCESTECKAFISISQWLYSAGWVVKYWLVVKYTKGPICSAIDIPVRCSPSQPPARHKSDPGPREGLQLLPCLAWTLSAAGVAPLPVPQVLSRPRTSHGSSFILP